jgi:hypothetical protein
MAAYGYKVGILGIHASSQDKNTLIKSEFHEILNAVIV